MRKTLKTTKTIALLIVGCLFAVGSILIAIHYAPDEATNDGQAKIYDSFN